MHRIWSAYCINSVHTPKYEAPGQTVLDYRYQIITTENLFVPNEKPSEMFNGFSLFQISPRGEIWKNENLGSITSGGSGGWQREATAARAISSLEPPYYMFRNASMDQFRVHFGLPQPHTNIRGKSWDRWWQKW